MAWMLSNHHRAPGWMTWSCLNCMLPACWRLRVREKCVYGVGGLEHKSVLFQDSSSWNMKWIFHVLLNIPDFYRHSFINFVTQTLQRMFQQHYTARWDPHSVGSLYLSWNKSIHRNKIFIECSLEKSFCMHPAYLEFDMFSFGVYVNVS